MLQYPPTLGSIIAPKIDALSKRGQQSQSSEPRFEIRATGAQAAKPSRIKPGQNRNNIGGEASRLLSFNEADVTAAFDTGDLYL